MEGLQRNIESLKARGVYGVCWFADYLDSKSSPDVRGAVDAVAKITDLNPIGSPRNVHGIHLGVNESFINEYIFQKRGEFHYHLPQNVWRFQENLCSV